jgi:hypothetical protein
MKKVLSLIICILLCATISAQVPDTIKNTDEQYLAPTAGITNGYLLGNNDFFVLDYFFDIGDNSFVDAANYQIKIGIGGQSMLSLGALSQDGFTDPSLFNVDYEFILSEKKNSVVSGYVNTVFDESFDFIFFLPGVKFTFGPPRSNFTIAYNPSINLILDDFDLDFESTALIDGYNHNAGLQLNAFHGFKGSKISLFTNNNFTFGDLKTTINRTGIIFDTDAARISGYTSNVRYSIGVPGFNAQWETFFGASIAFKF